MKKPNVREASEDYGMIFQTYASIFISKHNSILLADTVTGYVDMCT